MATYNVVIKTRRDTAADWTSNNPTLAEGEFGWESDTGKIKIGDGATAWTSLAYALTPYDADLEAIAALVYGTNELAYYDGAAWAKMSVSNYARSFLVATDEANLKAIVNLEVGVDIASIGANTFTGTQDFNGQQVEGALNKVVASVTGALTAADHSGNVLKTSGNVTIPTTAGFNCILIAGGAHTVTFNATTSAAMATGDLMTVVVESSTVIHAVLTASANKVSFA